MSAAFGPSLIFDLYATDARALELTNGANHIQWPAIPCVGIGNDGDGGDVGHTFSLIHNFGKRQQSNIGCAQTRNRYPRAGHVRRFAAGLFGESNRQTVKGARCDQQRRVGNERAQLLIFSGMNAE